MDYVKEIAGDTAFTTPQYWECERKGKDREDLPEYKLKIKSAILLFFKNNLRNIIITQVFWSTAVLPKRLSEVRLLIAN